MSVRIRLKRMGSKKKPFYRIIATDSRMPRDGRFIEAVGYYNPMTNPPEIQVREEILFKWFDRGATPTENAASILRRVGSLQKWDLIKAGVTGEELEMKVEAIKNQQLAAASKKEMKKKQAKAPKASAEGETEGEDAKPAVEAEEGQATEAEASTDESPSS
ncbi:MAG: 30S ribosomal protein S16 [Candidatus Latescibacterota bacterium]|nr:MAG: 30S ribosomal protein S16 [Candidatus Latescibacterota bacterium]